MSLVKSFALTTVVALMLHFASPAGLKPRPVESFRSCGCSRPAGTISGQRRDIDEPCRLQTRCAPWRRVGERPCQRSRPVADVKVEQIVNVSSTDITVENWLTLANRINTIYQSDSRGRRGRGDTRDEHARGDGVSPQSDGAKMIDRSSWSGRCARRRRSAPTGRSTC